MDYINKEDRENIKQLNIAFGTRHRYKPYDFKKSKDVVEAATMATAEYLDLFNYWIALNNIDEAFDESLENYNTAAWVKIGLKGATGNRKIDTAQICLQNAESYFLELLNDAEVKCADMWRIVLFDSSDSVKEHFFGKAANYDENNVEQALEEVFKLTEEIEYNGDIETSAKSFAGVLYSKL